MLKVYDNIIEFPREVRPQLLDQLDPVVWDFVEREDDSPPLILDFSRSIVSFPNAMVPIIAWVWFARHGGLRIEVKFPTADLLSQKFRERNWSQLLMPGSEPLMPPTSTAFPVHRYTDERELTTVANGMFDCLVNSIQLSPQSLIALDWSLGEIADNVLNHAMSPIGGFVQLQPAPDRVNIVVADGGRGLWQSLRHTYPLPKEGEIEAIKLAVKAGITRDRRIGAGMGMTGAHQVARESGGQFCVRSTHAYVRWAGKDDAVSRLFDDPFPGTCVDIQIRTDVEFDVDSAIGGVASGYVGFHKLEERYLTDDLMYFRFVVAAEDFGVRSRRAGHAARTRLLNTIAADHTKAVLIDWENVRVVSSGFADELVAKLINDLGQTEFDRRIRCVGMSPTVEKIIQAVISNRLTRPTD